MKNQYPVIKKICAECRKTRLIACVLWSVLTIIFLAAGGLGVFSMTAPVRSLFSAAPKELAGRFVTAKVEQVITPYMSYGTGEALANTTYMEFIIEAADNTYCAVRLSGRKMRQMYSASQTDGVLDEPITIYGKMGKMPRDSAEFYEQTLKEALGSDEVPAEFTKYLAKDPAEIFYKETNSQRTINNLLNHDYKLGIIRYADNYDRYFKAMLEEKGLAEKKVVDGTHLVDPVLILLHPGSQFFQTHAFVPLLAGIPDQQTLAQSGTEGIHHLHGSFGILFLQLLGGDDSRAHGETDEQVDDKVDEGSAAAHGGHGGFSRELSHHRHVGGVEEKLEDTRGHDGNGEADHFTEDGAENGTGDPVHMVKESDTEKIEEFIFSVTVILRFNGIGFIGERSDQIVAQKTRIGTECPQKRQSVNGIADIDHKCQKCR